MPVMLRDAAEMRRIVARNPFAGRPGNRVGVHFLDRPVTEAMLAECPGKAGDEEISPGECEFYVHYGRGMGRTKLRFPAVRACTVRNMNTVETLADMLES
ncbi:DUF1697 domain-containing protein [Nguyenibacter sp. L1]|uniref:DUF1697 domain-containing protein n=1 Tax=Nguyenibacter sp. L1 TaxID=3049350 RepID=UPI002B49C400|nr:DUF1697 domain-containing protein [Nguyenibacter sp. L1]WRH88806.1 DUF1697 domain-containing protein [Nguyenibacter sp. L1]